VRLAGKHLSQKDLLEVSHNITRFVSNYVKSSGAKGLVMGLSGGLDSALALELCAKAVGSKRVLGLALPTSATPPGDVSDAVSHASSLGVECKVISIDPLMESYAKLLPEAGDRAKGNLTARIRMGILYHFAASKDSLVIGTSDRSEIMIGYYTKWGDGGSDLLPIAGLYKTQVRELADHLGVPKQIIEKKSSPRLWPGQLAELEIGMSYEGIDPILYLLMDKKMKLREVAKKLDISLASVRKIESMIEKSAHKRSMPPAARVQ
jgi:NAD+ synthase